MTKSKINTHIRENNKESQQHLEENEQLFSDQCLKVMQLLNKGIRLTVLEAHKMGISSLPRRIKDLRDRNNITNIKDEWVVDGKGKKLYKQWFIPGLRPPTKKQVAKKHESGVGQSPLFQ